MSDSKSTEELRRKLCECLNIFPEEIQHHLPVNIGESNIRDLEQLFDKEINAAKIDELQNLIPEPVVEMASIDHEDELKRLFEHIRERLATLKTQTTEEHR